MDAPDLPPRPVALSIPPTASSAAEEADEERRFTEIVHPSLIELARLLDYILALPAPHRAASAHAAFDLLDPENWKPIYAFPDVAALFNKWRDVLDELF